MVLNPNSDTAASFDRPLQLLHACHGKLMHQCGTLRNLVDHLNQHGGDGQAQQAAQAVLRYFTTAALLHHQDEEDDLFPALRAAVPAGDNHMGALLADLEAGHSALETQWQGLQPLLQQLADGTGTELPAEQVEAFVTGYFAHIAVEEKELLPLAEYLLKPDQLAEIGQRMAARRNVVI